MHVHRGIAFQTFNEVQRYQELLRMAEAGEIRSLETHPRYPLVVRGMRVWRDYRASFRYSVRGVEVVEDATRDRTAASRLKRRLVLALHGVKIVEV